MKGRIIKDWGQVKFTDPVARKKLMGALQHFMLAPDAKDGPIRAALQAFTTKGDFPAEILQVLEKFHATPSYDLGYEQIFDVRPFQGTTASGFKINNVTSGLTFGKVLPGEKAKVYQMSGTAAEVTFDLYGGGLNWLRTLIDDQQYWTLEDNAIEFRNQAYSSRSADFYALIEAVAGNGNAQSWAAVEPASVSSAAENYNAIRDCNTINAACLAILSDLKDLGVGATPQSQFILLAPIALKSRVLRALAIVQQAFAGSASRLSFNVNPLFTMMLSSDTYYYVIFPKAKMKGGYRMDLTVYDQFDITAYADTMVGWQRYGGAIGDVNQVARCALS